MTGSLLTALLAGPAAADLRVATWGAVLSRDGPGLLLRDLLRGEDEGLAAVVTTIAAVRPDVILLTEMDWDRDGAALAALGDVLAQAGAAYPHALALRPNAGMATGLDMDGNGRAGEPRDAQGYGRFAGDGGLALLSRWPLGPALDLSPLLWRDLPGARLPAMDGLPFPSSEALAVQRLSSTGHWIVPVEAPDGPLTLLAWAATPPVFDGPEDRNGLRGADELALWRAVLDGRVPGLARPEAFVILGNANLDPRDGAGLNADMAAFLADPRLQDPRPSSDGARLAADPGHRGDPALDTADWPGLDPATGAWGPGNLRVSYVLPSADWAVTGAGVAWPDGEARPAGPHALVWVDIAGLRGGASN